MLMQMTTDFVRDLLNSETSKIYFPNSGLFPNGLEIDNVMFTIPGIGLDIYWYGFLIALGMLLAILYAFKRVRKFGLEPDRFTDTVLVGLIGGVLGARLFYVIFRLETYLNDDGTFNFADAINIRDGGLAIYGGVIGALILGCTMAKIRKVHIPALLDLVGMGFLIGQCLGRWGNFFNQEAFGTKTAMPWGMTSQKIINYLYDFYNPGESIVTSRAVDMVAHPCFLYESLWCLAGFLFLHFYSKHRKFDGELFLMYIGWYGLGRFWIEALRTDSLYLVDTEFLKLKVSQVIAGTCVIFAATLLVYMYMRIKKNGYTFYVDTEESKLLLAEYDVKAKKSKKPSPDDETDVHILEEEYLNEIVKSRENNGSEDAVENTEE